MTATVATHEARARLLARGWSTANRPGACAVCGTPFYPPQAIRYEPTDTPTTEYRAECCPRGEHGDPPAVAPPRTPPRARYRETRRNR